MTNKWRNLLSLPLFLMSLQSFFAKDLTHSHIPSALYDELENCAHLIDIAYCISPFTRIEEPFQCDNQCSNFPGTKVVYQWTSDEMQITHSLATSGYLAVNEDLEVILFVLRGTKSFKDTLIDIDIDMTPYNDLDSTCFNCKVHNGFYMSFQNTWAKTEDQLINQLKHYPNFKVYVMGHSLGGAIAVLLSLRIIDLGLTTNIKCITMGQPLIGNSYFAQYTNNALGLNGEDSFSEGRLLRITHKNDPIVKLPFSEKYILFDRYTHTNNEIFIDEIGKEVTDIRDIIFCKGNADARCAAGMRFTKDNREHLNYFKKMGDCGVSFFANSISSVSLSNSD